jgi:hypothetical protein
MPALIALLDMTAKRRGATKFDRGHDASLRGAQRCVMLHAIGVAVPAEHVRHFRPRPSHEAPAQKYLRAAGGNTAGGGRDNSSRGLSVAQTLLVAIRRYRAVVAKQRFAA